MHRWLVALGLVCGAYGGVVRASGEPSIGANAPDFGAKSPVTHETVRLSEQHGKLVFLTFWASWCPPCRKELPILENVQKRLGKDKVRVLAVSFHDSENAIGALARFAKSQDWQLTLLEDPSSRIARLYGVETIPHLFVIGRDGTILAVNAGYGDSSVEELVREINAALQGSARAEQ